MTETRPEALDAQGWSAYDDRSFIGHIGPILIRDTEAGRIFCLPTTEIHKNLSGNVHGGVIMSLLDRAMGAVIRHQAPHLRFATASMTTDFLRPAHIGDLITFQAQVVKAGRKAFNLRGEAYVGDKLCAVTSAVFMVLD